MQIYSRDRWYGTRSSFTQPTSNTLRFYALDSPAANRGDSTYLPSAQHDFTAPNTTKFTFGINDVIVEQFNSAKSLEQALQNTQHRKVEEQKWLRSLGSLIVQLLGALSSISTAIFNAPVVPGPSFPLLKDISATSEWLSPERRALLTVGDVFHRNSKQWRHHNDDITAPRYAGATYCSYLYLLHHLWGCLPEDAEDGRFAVESFSG
ncbi:hypothetical protein H0H87_008928 [Tephrocybe sp. NHM501043]|nr:hypothetical protein H0H87_008928 [Tephrocybe sp. NHM501043]